MKIVFFAVIAVTWFTGLWHLWRRQTASTNVDVNFHDRLIAIFWLPLFAMFLIVSLPGYLLRKRQRR